MNKKQQVIPVVVIAVLLIAYNIIRVFKVPVTYDEAATYFYYLTTSYKNITANIPVSANNHILNSLFSKVFIDIFGHGIFFLRLTNILAQLIYLAFCYRIAKTLFSNTYWILASFLFLNLNPFLFDFWGLCRGYGLSIEFMSGSVYFFIRHLKTKLSRHLIMSLLLAIAAGYSNFALLHFYVALVAVCVVNIISNNTPGWKRNTAILVVCTIIVYALTWNLATELRNSGELYFGGDKGIIENTFVSLLRASLFISKDVDSYLLPIAYGIAASIITAGVYWGVQIKKDHSYSNNPGFLLWLLLCIILASIKLQFIIYHTLYLIERTALFIFPLYILQLVCYLYQVSKKRSRFAMIVSGVLTVIAAVNFLLHVNTSYALSWKYNMHDKQLMEKMISSIKHPGDKIKLKLYWSFIPTFRYYAVNYYPQYFQYIESRDEAAQKGTSYDYYYIHRDEKAEVPPEYILDTSFDNGRFLLYRKP